MNWAQMDVDRIKGNQARMTVGSIWDDDADTTEEIAGR